MTAVVISALGAGGVLPGGEGGWTEVAVIGGGLLLGMLAFGAVPASAPAGTAVGDSSPDATPS